MVKASGSSGVQASPNIVVVMADDVGWFNVGAYHRGLAAGRTPHIDRLAAGGMLFTDYYAEASCRAGHANFLTGQLPIRTGLTAVTSGGAAAGLSDEVPTVATALHALGYATGQFGQSHLGERNEFLPTLHGFDEFFGYLHHLDSMEDPTQPDVTNPFDDDLGPRNLVHAWASPADDPRVDPRWGRVGRQRILDAGPLYPRRVELVDDEILAQALRFIDEATAQGQPFFVCVSPMRMRMVSHLAEKYERLRTPENGWGLYEAGMAQLDDLVGALLDKLAADGLEENTIVVFTTDHGAETFTWSDGAQTPFAGGKGTVMEGGFRVPCLVRWPGRIRAGKVENGLMSGLDWFPTFVAAAGGPRIVEELKRGTTLGGRHFRAHLDGYDQLGFLTGAQPSQRNEIYYFADGALGAVRIGDYKYRFIDQAQSWLGCSYKAQWPLLTNVRLDPFERTGVSGEWDLAGLAPYEHWRFVFVQQEVTRFGTSFLEFPPLKPPPSFNLDAVKEQVAMAMQVHRGA